MNTLTLLEDYEQFTAYFHSLEAAEDCPDPQDLDSILDSLTEEISHELY